MLSHILTLARSYEASQGARPNLVYLNGRHFECLREEIPGMNDAGAIERLLGLEVVVHEAVVNPSVATARVTANRVFVS